MRHQLSITAFIGVLALTSLATAVAAQAPAPAPLQVPNPTYISIPLEIAINRPAAEVWKRVGKFCDIGEWLRISVHDHVREGRRVRRRTFRCRRSPRGQDRPVLHLHPDREEGRPYNLYHGTLEARPVTPTTSKLVYTLFFDNSMLADDAARERDRTQKTATFTRALENMKILAEGGTLPPAPPRGAPPTGGAPPAGR